MCQYVCLCLCAYACDCVSLCTGQSSKLSTHTSAPLVCLPLHTQLELSENQSQTQARQPHLHQTAPYHLCHHISTHSLTHTHTHICIRMQTHRDTCYSRSIYTHTSLTTHNDTYTHAHGHNYHELSTIFNIDFMIEMHGTGINQRTSQLTAQPRGRCRPVVSQFSSLPPPYTPPLISSQLS